MADGRREREERGEGKEVEERGRTSGEGGRVSDATPKFNMSCLKIR